MPVILPSPEFSDSPSSTSDEEDDPDASVEKPLPKRAIPLQYDNIDWPSNADLLESPVTMYTLIHSGRRRSSEVAGTTSTEESFDDSENDAWLEPYTEPSSETVLSKVTRDLTIQHLSKEVIDSAKNLPASLKGKGEREILNYLLKIPDKATVPLAAPPDVSGGIRAIDTKKGQMESQSETLSAETTSVKDTSTDQSEKASPKSLPEASDKPAVENGQSPEAVVSVEGAPKVLSDESSSESHDEATPEENSVSAPAEPAAMPSPANADPVEEDSPELKDKKMFLRFLLEVSDQTARENGQDPPVVISVKDDMSVRDLFKAARKAMPKKPVPPVELPIEIFTDSASDASSTEEDVEVAQYYAAGPRTSSRSPPGTFGQTLQQNNQSWRKEHLNDAAAQKALEKAQKKAAEFKAKQAERFASGRASPLTPHRKLTARDTGPISFFDPLNLIAEKKAMEETAQYEADFQREASTPDFDTVQPASPEFAELTRIYSASRDILFFHTLPPSQLVTPLHSLTLPKNALDEMTADTDPMKLLGKLKLVRNVSLLNYERALIVNSQCAGLGVSDAVCYTDRRQALRAAKDNLYMINRLRVKLEWKSREDFEKEALSPFFIDACDEFDNPTATSIVLANNMPLSVLMGRLFRRVQKLGRYWDYLYNGREESSEVRSQWVLRKRREFVLFAQAKDAITATLGATDFAPDENLLLLYCLTKITIFMDDILEEEKMLVSKGDIDLAAGIAGKGTDFQEDIVPKNQAPYDIDDRFCFKQKYPSPYFRKPFDAVINELVPFDFAVLLLKLPEITDVLDVESCSGVPYLVKYHRQLLLKDPKAEEHIFVANFVNRLLLGRHFVTLVESEIFKETPPIASFYYGHQKGAFMDENSKPVMYAKVGLVKVYWNPKRENASYELLAKATGTDRKSLTMGNVLEGFSGFGLFLDENIKRRIVSTGDIRKGIKRWEELHKELIGSVWIYRNPKIMSWEPILGNPYLAKLRQERTLEIANAADMRNRANAASGNHENECMQRAMQEAQVRATILWRNQRELTEDDAPSEPPKEPPLPVYRARPTHPITNNPNLMRVIDRIHKSSGKRGREMFLEAISAPGDDSSDSDGHGIGDSFKFDL